MPPSTTNPSLAGKDLLFICSLSILCWTPLVVCCYVHSVLLEECFDTSWFHFRIVNALLVVLPGEKLYSTSGIYPGQTKESRKFPGQGPPYSYYSSEIFNC